MHPKTREVKLTVMAGMSDQGKMYCSPCCPFCRKIVGQNEYWQREYDIFVCSLYHCELNVEDFHYPLCDSTCKAEFEKND